MNETCQVCGCQRHSLFRYVKGWLCYQLYMHMPDALIFGRTWRFWNDMLLPSVGDYIYDLRGCCPSPTLPCEG